jgi:hypothetical protein
MMFLVVLNSFHSRCRVHLADRRRCWCMGSSPGGTGSAGFDRRIGLKFLGLTDVLCMIRQKKLNKGVTQWD